MTPRRPSLGRLGILLGTGAALVWVTAGAVTPGDAAAQDAARPNSQFAGLQWTFARIRYDGSKLPGLSGCDTYDECWTIDYPAA
ncbi:MAG TPA: hypothetical protein VIX61_03845, partial [Casimicrobiaceae bacterium]